MTKEQITAKAKSITNGQSTEALIQAFEATNEQQMTPELAVTRGWIMDELEARDPEAFEAWMESSEDNIRACFLK